ncbi:MAG: hypothetical protein ACOY3Y_06465 [Acidobacteriota bacterium]
MNAVIDAPADTIPLGELKAIHREEHICPRCEHFVVCKVAAALDANLLVTITRCLAFEPVPGAADA